MDRARDRAEREFALEQQSNRSLNYNLGGRWASDMDRFSGQRRQQQLFKNCMTQRGYVLVSESDEQDRTPRPSDQDSNTD